MDDQDQDEEHFLIDARNPSSLKQEYDVENEGLEEPRPISIVIPPQSLQQGNVAVTVPLFLRKLWKMVNDVGAEDIISWNSTGDGFIIYDQLQFISQLLPKYFKHNHLASFIRQLNLYDFHKVANIDKDEMHFTHQYFLKDLPQMLSFIKRKTSVKHRSAVAEQNATELHSIIDNIKQMKSKHEVINNDLQRLQQENSALWKEMNSLRLKHSKQTKIINKLIHFLISYVHTHHTSNKNKKTVNQHLKSGPRLLELDYHDRGAEDDLEEQSVNDNYIVTEPESSSAVLDTTQTSSVDPTLTNVEPEPSSSNTLTQPSLKAQMSPSSTLHIPNFDLSLLNTLDSVAPPRNAAPSPTNAISLTNSTKSKEHLGLYIDNTQFELDSIQEMLKNLSPNDLASFYGLVNDNYNNQLGELAGMGVKMPPKETAQEEFLSNIDTLTDLSRLSQTENVTLTEAQDQELLNELDSVAAETSVDEYFAKENMVGSDEQNLISELEQAASVSNVDDYFNKEGL